MTPRQRWFTLAALLVGSFTIAALMPSKCRAEEWKPIDRQLFVAAVALSVVDWGQTRDIVRRPNEFHEKSPFLGKHPSMGEVNTHFLIRTAALSAAAFYLPEYRTSILGTYVAVTAVVVGRNAHLGLKVSF